MESPERWSRARPLDAKDVTPNQERLFWEKVDKTAECWVWTARRNVRGYGTVGIGTKANPRQVLAHRMAHALEVGPVPARLYVLHSCDNPSCVRPAHLSLGTHADNQQQKAERGRAGVRRGEENGNAILTAARVAEMRAIYPTIARGLRLLTLRAWADYLGVSFRTVEAAVRGESRKTEWVLAEGPDAVRERCGV